MSRTLVAGIDSSTQSTKVLLVDADTGEVVDEARAKHPDGTEVDPQAWLDALDAAGAGLLEQAAAVAVGGQQHGLVALDENNQVVRDALLWNDTRSAGAAEDLIAEMGGPKACAEATGSLLVPSITSTKLRWVRDNEPENAARIKRVLLPHDYLTWHLNADKTRFTTDRGDASGTGYYSTANNAWDPALAEAALGHAFELPEVAEPNAVVGETAWGAKIAPGTGDNMAAALGLNLKRGDVSLSVGTSGVAAMVSPTPTADETGLVAGFADATGQYLPLACTLNAARILDFGARILGVDHAALAELALDSVPGANGVTLLPYLDGERTPNRPDATGTLVGLTTSTSRADIARACVEGLLCSLADAVEYLEEATGTSAERIFLIGGGAKSAAVRELAPSILGRDVVVPPEREYVALGAARQAAWALTGREPEWEVAGEKIYSAEPTPHVLAQYRELKDNTAGW